MAFFRLFSIILATYPSPTLAKTGLWAKVNFLVREGCRVSSGVGLVWALVRFWSKIE